MNIFKWITDRAGKVALSAMQAVGLSAVVGVAGIAAWQYLDSPAENNSFTPAGYNPGEVVYVAGANTGSYAGGSYAGGGESPSSVQISANTFKRLERQELAEQAAADMAEYSPEYSGPVSSSASSVGSAHQMGGTDGLGTGANAANEMALKNDPFAAMQQSMAGVSSMVSQVQQQAQQQAQAGKDGAQTGGASSPALASASKNWGSSGATGGTAGNAFNSSFSVQDSGKNKSDSIPSAAAMRQAGDAIASAQTQASRMMEGARIQGRASFGNSGMIGDNRDATVQNFRNSKDPRDLDFIRRRSADAAKNKNRATVEGARAFLASAKISGGMMISAENVTTGQGQGSKDFDTDYEANLRGIGIWRANQDDTSHRRDKDRHDMQTWFWVAMGVATAAIIAIPFVKKIPIWGWWIALGLAAVATAFCVVGFAKANSFAKNWGATGYSTMAQIGTGVMVLGIWLSFFLSHLAKDMVMKEVPKLLGVSAGAGTAIGVGVGGASMGMLGASLGGSEETGK